MRTQGRLVAVAVLMISPALLGSAGRAGGAGPVPDDVVAAALRSASVPYSGTVEVDGWLGLPTLPLTGDATAQLDRTTRMRTWWISPTVWRTDVVASLPALPGLQLPRPADLTPPSSARLLLGWLSADDSRRALPPQRIAGHDASGVRVVSGERGSSVGTLEVWVDTLTGLPLELDLYGRGNAVPMFRTRFLDVTTQRPDPAVVSASGSALVAGPLAGRSIWSLLPPARGAAGAAGIATSGTGFARLALTQLPSGVAPPVDSDVLTQTVAVSSGTAAVLRSGLLQVALLRTASGRGYLLAGTLTTDAMDAAVRATLATLAALPPSR